MSELDYKGEHCFLVAAEKQDPCYLFSEDGERLETVWEEPGGGMNYLIVCCLKTGHEYKNDWRFPGACYGAVLPEDLSGYDESHPLKLTKLMGNMLKNHGYSKVNYGGYEAALVGWRKGTKDTIAITWDKDAGNYHVDFIDRNTGCANAMHFKNKQGEDILVATNREIDEIAMYKLSE